MTENPVTPAVLSTSGAVVLPNTGGNSVLTVIAISAILVGVAILLTMGAKSVAKRVYKA